MPLLNSLNQPIVLVDLFMINMTPTIFYFRFIFLVYSTLFFNLEYFFSGAVFLAISPLVPCGNTAFSLWCLFFSILYLCCYNEKKERKPGVL